MILISLCKIDIRVTDYKIYSIEAYQNSIEVFARRNEAIKHFLHMKLAIKPFFETRSFFPAYILFHFQRRF